jgi:1-acyl-sn-glycerol-3-phosphate acyltransferase
VLRLARVLVFVQVGKITVVGRERLPSTDAPYLVVANHTHYADGPVIGLTLGVRARPRYFIARGVLRFGRGLAALVLGPAGAIAVDLRPSGGRRELAAGVRVLASGERLVLFPEGWAHMDGHRGTFKRGAAYVAIRAAERRGRPIAIVPCYLHYPRHPGEWMTRMRPSLQYFLTAMGFWRYRRGVTAVIGPPILSDTLPASWDEATAFLETRIRALSPTSTRAARMES